MMQASIAMATTRFSSDRMVKEYFERLYERLAAGLIADPGCWASGSIAPRTAT